MLRSCDMLCDFDWLWLLSALADSFSLADTERLFDWLTLCHLLMLSLCDSLRLRS